MVLAPRIGIKLPVHRSRTWKEELGLVQALSCAILQPSARALSQVSDSIATKTKVPTMVLRQSRQHTATAICTATFENMPIVLAVTHVRVSEAKASHSLRILTVVHGNAYPMDFGPLPAALAEW